MHLVKLNRNSPAGENDNLDSNSFSDSQPPPHTLLVLFHSSLFMRRGKVKLILLHNRNGLSITDGKLRSRKDYAGEGVLGDC